MKPSQIDMLIPAYAGISIFENKKIRLKDNPCN